MSKKMHLKVAGQDPIEDSYGCDYAWNADYSAYRTLPQRWTPGSDASYARWQSDWQDDE